MKFKTLLKTLPLAVGLGFCSTANAGVVATSYLELSNLFVQISTDGDITNGGEVAPGDIGQFIQITNSSRETNTSVNYNGATDGSINSTTTPGAASNAGITCSGPACGGFLVGDNGYSLDANNLVYTDALGYAIGDVNVSGSALGGGASGFTYADVGIETASNNTTASASSNIFNNVFTKLTFTVLQDAAIRFTALYDLFVDAIISNDIAADGNRFATASSKAEFNITATRIGGGIVLNDGITASRLVFDAVGLNNFGPITENDQNFVSEWANVSTGTYQVTITQGSAVQASLIPEPGAIVLFGMGLLGLGLRARAKATK